MPCGASGLPSTGSSSPLFAARIFYRAVTPGDLTPMLWVVMGAAAISTNAGSTLILTDSGLAFLTSMRPFIDGVTLMIWAWATWWIPLLVIFGVWKHGVHRVPLTYTPLLWSMVFPLGMYSLATARLSLAADFPPLHSRRTRHDVARARGVDRDRGGARRRNMAERAG